MCGPLDITTYHPQRIYPCTARRERVQNRENLNVQEKRDSEYTEPRGALFCSYLGDKESEREKKKNDVLQIISAIILHDKTVGSKSARGPPLRDSE